MKLKSRSGFPPGGWQYLQPETNWQLPNPMSHSFDAAVNDIIAHRRNNPRFSLKTDYDSVAGDLEIYTIQRLKFDPNWVMTTPEDQKKTLLPTPLLPPKRVAVPFVQRLKQLYEQGKVGKETLKEWIGEGGKPVLDSLAENRARICTTCPKNVQGDILDSLTGSVAKLLKSQVEAKNHLSLKVPDEDNLGTCEVCGCKLGLKVWVPLSHIKNHMPTEEVAELPMNCWIRQEMENRILVVIPYCNHDFNQAKKVLEWMNEIKGVQSNPCLLVADIKVPTEQQNILIKLASNIFREVRSITTPYSLPNERWPIGPNWMFQTTLKYVYEEWPMPFLFLEPDAIPLHEKWLFNLEEEYFRVGKPYMGAIVSASGQTNVPGDHLTGVAIYPADAYERLKGIFTDPRAFDMSMAPLVVPETHHTKQHVHFWGNHKLPPTFRRHRGPDNPNNTLLFGFIPKGSSIFHRNKDGSLIDLLRETR